MKISPALLTRFSNARLRSSSTSSRKHTTENGRGAHTSQPGSAATHSSKRAASSTPFRTWAPLNHRCGRRRTDGSDDGGRVGKLPQLVRAEPELLVARHLPRPHPKDPGRRVHRGVRLL